MAGRRWVAIAIGGWMLGFASSAAAAAPPAKDYSQSALNIIPSGQYGGAPPAPGADTQALMYDGLTPLFDHVTPADLTRYFKSEKFGISTAGPGTTATPARTSRSVRYSGYSRTFGGFLA